MIDFITSWNYHLIPILLMRLFFKIKLFAIICGLYIANITFFNSYAVLVDSNKLAKYQIIKAVDREKEFLKKRQENHLTKIAESEKQKI